MRTLENSIIQEKYYQVVLDNGLTVYLMPKNEFYKTYAIFSTKFGSRDTQFIPRGQTEFIKTPEGIAHFLEHKLFEQENGMDASTIFAKYGADVNAYTTNSQTSYLFSTTSDVSECVELLLDFVQTPYFTEEGINKERGIIEQELLMYLDQPGNVQYYGILKALYKENNIRNEIGGSVESIKEINEELLYTCYNTFYHPSNMTLVVIGHFDLDEMLELIKNNQNKKQFSKSVPIVRKYIEENDEVNEKNSYTEMNIYIPKVSVGLKFPCPKLDHISHLKRFLAIELLIDLYFDESTSCYEELIIGGYINNSFDYSLFYDETYGHFLLNVDNNEPDKFIDKMKSLINEMACNDINEEDFIRLKKLYQARAIKRFNSLEYIANSLTEAHMDGHTLFDYIEILNTIEIKDLEDVRSLFKEESTSTFTIFPNEE